MCLLLDCFSVSTFIDVTLHVKLFNSVCSLLFRNQCTMCHIEDSKPSATFHPVHFRCRPVSHAGSLSMSHQHIVLANY